MQNKKIKREKVKGEMLNAKFKNQNAKPTDKE
jgi:hypothetical protein